MTSVTYFDTVQRDFCDVVVTEEGIDTVTFLEATEGVIKLFDLLGSSAFNVVQKDMTGNVNKIRTRYEVDRIKHNTLENLVICEQKEKKRTATEGLLWLKRGLEFTSVALRRSINETTEELSVSFTNAYGGTLKQFHSYLIRPVFTLAMKACPYRVEFFKKLGDDQARVNEQYERWLAALERIVAKLNYFYEQGGHDKGF
ncbi:glycolipid transfer protein domain-containing protein [Gigaspora rosea]|uniref:Glycolipid transfer protein domain-containing protein n=1 Tax=Gigaspora rosea TaxID=44941 RepID=A0A397VRK3_9GLOM|nr:glycolipid transfer protein domain-containing protein [Gigaspora rosea]CAG8694245.1 12325_t:CDS:2 [Gigaspora rosea]